MIACFGEILLRMSPALHGDWINHAQMPVYIGGAELNVATALAKWGMPVSYITAMPENYLSQEILSNLDEKKIGRSSIKLSGDRIGVYYLPQGTDLKNAGVIYDRAHSSFSQLKPGDIDWDKALINVNWFHFSAISPALNEQAAEVCLEAIHAAKKRSIPVSVDLNYRAKLWQYGKSPADVMPQLVQYCDVIMGNLWAAEKLLNVSSGLPDTVGQSQQQLVEYAAKSMENLKTGFPNAKTIAYTFRLEETYFAVMNNMNNLVVSAESNKPVVIDKVGSGDCFMAGLIYGLLSQYNNQEIIDFATAAAITKMQVVGDATNLSVEDIYQKIQQQWIA